MQAESNTPPLPTRTTWDTLPALDLRHVVRLTDDTAIFQHALYATRDPNHGYCIDDNSRALIAAMNEVQLVGYGKTQLPYHRYLAFITYAFNAEHGLFRNFMGFDRQWLESFGSDDSQGRTLWALGMAVKYQPDENIGQLANEFVERSLHGIEHIRSPRAMAFSLIGLHAYLSARPDDGKAKQVQQLLGEVLYQLWQENQREDWPWWEDIATYDNGKLPHALIITGDMCKRNDWVQAGLQALQWLIDVQRTEAGHLSIIGNAGWLTVDGRRAQFDQQPLDAYAMVDACLRAAQVTGNRAWADHALWAFDWFRGANDLGLPLYDEMTGGCCDGLQPDGLNRNQGAESTLAYVLSLQELHLWHRASN